MPIAHLGIITGDLNSHHQFWGYDNNDNNRDTLNEWAERENIELVFDAKTKVHSDQGGGNETTIRTYAL